LLTDEVKNKSRLLKKIQKTKHQDISRPFFYFCIPKIGPQKQEMEGHTGEKTKTADSGRASHFLS